MKDSVKSAHVTNRANVLEKNKKSPIVPGKLLPASRVLWRSVLLLLLIPPKSQGCSVFKKFIVAWQSSQLPKQKEGLFY